MQFWAVLFVGISGRSVLRSVVRLLLPQAFWVPLIVTECCSDLIRYVVSHLQYLLEQSCCSLLSVDWLICSELEVVTRCRICE